MNFNLSSDCIETYYSKLIELFGYEYKKIEIKLIKDYQLKTDIKTKYVCGDKNVVITYNPRNLLRLSGDLDANARDLFIIGFVESLSYAVQQCFLHNNCLNNCKNCRLNIKAKKFCYLNTLITYKCLYKLFPERKYRNIINKILQLTCGKKFKRIKQEILNTPLKKSNIEQLKVILVNDKYANFIFHVYKKYNLLPKTFAIKYIVEKSAEEKKELFKKNERKINEIFLNAKSDQQAIHNIKKINKRFSKAMDTLYKEFSPFYDEEIKQMNQSFINRIKKINWNLVINNITKIEGLKLNNIKKMTIYPCATLMGSGFLKHDQIYCSPVKSGDGGIIHEIIHRAIRDKISISEINIAKWRRLIKNSSYSPLDYIEQGYVFLIEYFIKDKTNLFRLNDKKKFFKENGFLEVYNAFKKYDFYNELSIKKYIKKIENEF